MCLWPNFFKKNSFRTQTIRANWKYLISLEMELFYLIFSFMFLSINSFTKARWESSYVVWPKSTSSKCFCFFVLVYGRKVRRTVLFRGGWNQGKTSIKINSKHPEKYRSKTSISNYTSISLNQQFFSCSLPLAEK